MLEYVKDAIVHDFADDPVRANYGTTDTFDDNQLAVSTGYVPASASP